MRRAGVSFESIELPEEPVIVPGNTAVDFRLSPNGWHLGGYALPMLGVENLGAIINMPYAFMANTPIYYRADPDSTLLEGTSEEVQLGVFSHYNTSIAGQTKVEVSVEEEDYKIVMSSDLNSIYPQRTGGVESTQIEVKVLKENEPVARFPLELNVNPVPNSGGHDHHDDQRPVGMLTSATGETDENGIFTTTFISSEIGGEEWIVASSLKTNHSDSASIKVEIPNLSNFSNIESEKWRLTGNTGSTSYGPCFGRELQHQNNHYLTSATKNNLQDAIKSFFNWTGTEEGVGNLVVGMNDMSLLKGGLFDICSNWDIGHNSHRLGIDTDIDRIATILNNTTENIDLRAEENLYLLQKLEEFIRIKGGVRIKSLGLHFRFMEN